MAVTNTFAIFDLGRSTRLRTHRSEPEGDGCGDADCREVGVGAAVVAGVDAPPIFEATKHVFDPVTLFVEDGVIGDGDLPIGFRGDAGGEAALGEGSAEPIGVVALSARSSLASGRAGNISAAPL